MTLNGMRGRRSAVWLAALVLLAGCFQQEATVPAVPTGSAAEATPVVSTPAAAAPTQTTDLRAPAALVTQAVGAGTLTLTRYGAGDELCVAASFDTRVQEATHCGVFSGTGVGYVDTLTDPQGSPVRVAYGLVDPAVTAVAVEFAAGGNANTSAQGGGYLLVLDANQTPQRAHGINTYGNLVGSWTFE